MTIEEFNSTSFHANMFCTYKGDRAFIISVNFEEALLGLAESKADIPAEEWLWVRCENVTLD